MTSAERLILFLKSSGHSVTQARLAVFTALSGQDPLSMRELVARTPSIDRASVYRAVNLFEQLHIVERIHTGWKYKLELSDAFADHHHHLTCTRCGRSIAIHETKLEAIIHKLAVAHGFEPSSHQIEMHGLCAACQKQDIKER